MDPHVDSGPQQATLKVRRADARVLVVDDSALLRRLLASTLTSLGFCRIEQAEDGEQAARLLAEATFDVVITDWGMPRMSGFELLRWIRAQPALSATHVLLVTGQHDRDQRLLALAAGASGYLTKPLADEALAHHLDQFVPPSEPLPEGRR